ncbi:MAG TPA: alkaline phosphatase family protein [Actinomycetota bacterium]|nr:alkaline phosphatase family protein [Actinomycetota bacterium]
MRDAGNRLWIVIGVAVVAAALAGYQLLPERGVPAGAPTLDEMASGLGGPIMEHLNRGHVPGRSGELLLVPKPHHYIIGKWDLTTLGTDAPTLTNSHPNPWAYIARVPIVLYGPPFVAEDRRVERSVDIADMAPTYAALLGMQALDADGEVLTEAVEDSPDRAPKVIFTIVLDGGGWNVLQEHPNSWPTIQSLREGGTDYINATIGSAPSITGALHATFGTGVYPVTHGIPGNQMRGPDGLNTDAWKQNADPEYLLVPTVSELWDEQNANEPIVGTVSYEGWHLGMIGHGAQREGGDKDIAVLWEAETNEWWINDDFYELPDYLAETDLDTLERYEEELDERDGLPDGLWFGHDLEELRDPVVRPGSSAFARFTGDAVVDVMRREKLGVDDVPDMFWVEMKMPDFAGHRWNMIGPEEADVLKVVDDQIARFKRELDRLAGPGNYVIAISADHGQQPLPELEGGWRINSNELLADIEARFGNVVEKITTVDIFFEPEAMENGDVDLEDVARFLGTYTVGDNIPRGAVGAGFVPVERLDDTIFAGAFPTNYLASPPMEFTEPSCEYPTESNLFGPPGPGSTCASVIE